MGDRGCEMDHRGPGSCHCWYSGWEDITIANLLCSGSSSTQNLRISKPISAPQAGLDVRCPENASPPPSGTPGRLGEVDKNLLARTGQAQCVKLCILESLCHLTLELARRHVCQAFWASCIGITGLWFEPSPKWETICYTCMMAYPAS